MSANFKTLTFQEWVCLLWKMFPHPAASFGTHIEQILFSPERYTAIQQTNPLSQMSADIAILQEWAVARTRKDVPTGMARGSAVDHKPAPKEKTTGSAASSSSAPPAGAVGPEADKDDAEDGSDAPCVIVKPPSPTHHELAHGQASTAH